jgi:hypothetical protein
MFALIGLLSMASASDSSAELTADLIRLEEGVVTADGGIRIVAGIHQVKAEVIRIDPDSDGRVHFYGEQLWWTPCTCERPPWAIRAAKGEGTFDEELTLRQATLEVCGAPLVPFPINAAPARGSVVGRGRKHGTRRCQCHLTDGLGRIGRRGETRGTGRCSSVHRLRCVRGHCRGVHGRGRSRSTMGRWRTVD